ncbi:glucose-6-phosphate 1-dehydrogenase, partial [Musa troglodytarum]
SQKGCPENISSRGVCENITSGGREKEGVKISAVGWNLDRTRVEGGLAVPAGVGASPTPVVRYGRGARHGLRVFVDRAALLPTTSPAPRHSLSSHSVEETTSNSEVAESSPPNVQPIIPKVILSEECGMEAQGRYDVEVPDSYEHLLLDVIDGDTHLFMRAAVGSCMEHTDPNSRQN